MNSQWYEENLLVNYFLKTIKKLRGMIPMRLSAPWYNSLDIIALYPVKILQGIDQMVISSPWADYPDIIDLKTV